jgi:hypothetical protein
MCRLVSWDATHANMYVHKHVLLFCKFIGFVKPAFVRGFFRQSATSCQSDANFCRLWKRHAIRRIKPYRLEIGGRYLYEGRRREEEGKKEGRRREEEGKKNGTRREEDGNMNQTTSSKSSAVGPTLVPP